MRSCLVLSAWLACSIAGGARADQAESDAKVHYDEAGKAFSLGEFERAAQEYRAAYQAKPDASFLYNIAQSYRLGNNFQQALFFYRSYLHSEPDASNRDEVEDRIHKLEAQIAAQRAVTAQPPNTTQGPTTTTPDSTIVVAPAPAPKAERRVSKKRWVWGVVAGVVVIGVGLGVGLGIGLSHPAPPGSQLGNTVVY